MQSDVETLLHLYREAGKEIAKARPIYEYLVDFKKHLIASLMQAAEKSGAKSAAAQEREALASDAYVTHLEAIREAHGEYVRASQKREEWGLAIEVWRTQQADQRTERKAYNA